MSTSDDRAGKDTLSGLLLIHCAEMLALPNLVCASRRCTRARRCILWDDDGGAPRCLFYLTDNEFAVYSALLEQTLEITDQLCENRWPQPLSPGETGELEAAATEIVSRVPLCRDIMRIALNGSIGQPADRSGRPA